MPPSLNTVALVGTLTEPPSPWDAVPEEGAQLSVAVPSESPDTDGAVSCIEVAVPGQQGTACVEHLREGSLVAVAGRLTDHGAGAWVIAQSVQFLTREPVAV